MTSTALSPRLRAILPAAVLIVLGVVCYANSFRNEFVWDDHIQIASNRMLRSWAFVPRFFTARAAEAYGASAESRHFYRPLWMLSQCIDYQLWGPNPSGFHLTNLVLQIANGLLVFGLMMALRIRMGFGMLVAALFICHPAHTETTTFIAGRTGELGVLFMLAALLLFFKFMSLGRDDRARRLVLFGSAGCFGLALLSKETAVTLFGIVGAAGWLLPASPPLRRRDWMMILIVFGLVSCAYFLARGLVLAQMTYPPQFSWPERFGLMMRALAAQVVFTLAPHNLHIDRTLVLDGWRGTALTVSGLATFAAIVLVGIWSYRRERRITFGLAFFVAAFSITSNLIPLNATFAERWLYWPMIGLAIVFAGGLEYVNGMAPRAAQVGVIAGWIGVGVFSAMTIVQNRVWRDDKSLFETAIARGADTPRERVSLASYYIDTGDFTRARRHLDQALRQQPGNVSALRTVGILYAMQEQYVQARDLLERAVNAAPNDTLAAVWLAAIQENLSEAAQAEQTLRNAVARAATSLAAVKLVDFCIRHDRLDEAERILNDLLAKDNLDAVAHNMLGTVLFRKGDLSDAEREFRLALRYDYWMIDAYANLAAAADARGDLEQALQHYRRALKLAPNNASLYYAMGVVLNRHGQSAEARQALTHALKLDPRFDEAKKLLHDLTNTQGTDNE
jgi:protein O-mannosyl-transferase